MNFENLLNGYRNNTCIISVEKLSDGNYGNIRILAGNQRHCDEMLNVMHRPFVPDSPYEEYFPKNKNFEDFCIRSAIDGQTLHSYVNLPQLGLWLNMFLLPLESDNENFGYCIYSYDVKPNADSEQRASLSADTSSAVLKTCIKLHGSTNIRQTLQEVIEDIRLICGSDRCCILMTDSDARKCTILGEAIKPDCKLLPFASHMNDAFYDFTRTWKETIGSSTCIILKNENDMEWLDSVNHQWAQDLINEFVTSMVMFPLNYNGEFLGYLWASNFNVKNTVKIKEALELTTFFIASEIANYRLMQKLKVIGSIDLLTGVKNRNTMNNAVDRIKTGKKIMPESYAVIFADLNGLKHINDEQGHGAGDQILKNAADILRGVFFDCEIYRAGGDEFLIITKKMNESELNVRLKRLEESAASAPNVHFSVGSCYVRDATDIRTALRIADERMYENKNAYYAAHPENKYK